MILDLIKRDTAVIKNVKEKLVSRKVAILPRRKKSTVTSKPAPKKKVATSKEPKPTKKANLGAKSILYCSELFAGVRDQFFGSETKNGYDTNEEVQKHNINFSKQLLFPFGARQ